MIKKVGSEMLDQLSSNVRPNERYKTDGAGLFVPGSFGVPNFSPKMMKAFLKAAPHSKGLLDLGKNLLKNYDGGAVDIHKAIGKLAKPKRGFTLPGHNYTSPYNSLEEQLKYHLEVYQMPTGKTDAIAMQHDVDYSVCKDDKRCKHEADKKMVKSLAVVPYNERQWGHWLARNAINTKQKLGLGVPKKTEKAVERRSIIGNNNWQMNYINP